MRKKSFISLFVIFLLVGGSLLLCARASPVSAADAPKLQLPAVIISLGQSPDAYTASLLAKRAGLNLDYENLLEPEHISNYKTVLMAVGASLKGFGSAGVNLDTELERGKKIVETVQANDVYLVLLHTGGEGRREQMSNKLLDAVAGQANLFVVLAASNQDNYFTNLAKEKNIPIIVVKNILDIQKLLKEMFPKS
jgi:hypothetical protein